MKNKEIAQWMSEEAAFYSKHREFPTVDMAEDAAARFVHRNDINAFTDPSVGDALMDSLIRLARRTIKNAGLSLNGDADD